MAEVVEQQSTLPMKAHAYCALQPPVGKHDNNDNIMVIDHNNIIVKLLGIYYNCTQVLILTALSSIHPVSPLVLDNMALSC